MSATASSVAGMSWDDIGQDDSDEDFLADVEAQEVPKACSLDNPDCEACQ